MFQLRLLSGEPPSAAAQSPNPEPRRRPPTPSAEPEHRTPTTRPSPHTVVTPSPIPASTLHAITHVTYVHHSRHVLLASRLADVHLLLTTKRGSPQTFFSLDSHLARYSSSCTSYYFIYIDLWTPTSLGPVPYLGSRGCPYKHSSSSDSCRCEV